MKKVLLLAVVLFFCSLDSLSARSIRSVSTEKVDISPDWISPALFRKIEETLQKEGFVKQGLWYVGDTGFSCRIKKPKKGIYDYCNAIITWNGEVIRYCQNGWLGTDINEVLFRWDDMRE